MNDQAPLPTPTPSWSKILVPIELNDLIRLIARNHGYRSMELYIFVYLLLKRAYPEDVARLTDYLETGWLDDALEQRPPK